MILSGQARKWMRVSPGVVSLVSPSEVSDDGSLGADVWPDDSSSDAEPPAVDHSPDRSGGADVWEPDALNTPYTSSAATTMTSSAVKRMLFLFINA